MSVSSNRFLVWNPPYPWCISLQVEELRNSENASKLSLFAFCGVINHWGQAMKQTRTVHLDESLLVHVLWMGRRWTPGCSRWLVPNPHTACPAEMDFCQRNFGMTTEMIQQMSELWSGGRTKFKARDRGAENAPGTWSRCELKEISNRLYAQLKCIISTYWMPGPLKIIILLGDIISSKQKELNGNFTVFKCHLATFFCPALSTREDLSRS